MRCSWSCILMFVALDLAILLLYLNLFRLRIPRGGGTLSPPSPASPQSLLQYVQKVTLNHANVPTAFGRVDHQQFIHLSHNLTEPLLLKDACKEWPASRAWSDTSLLSKAGNDTFLVQLQKRRTNADIVRKRLMKLSAFLQGFKNEDWFIMSELRSPALLADTQALALWNCSSMSVDKLHLLLSAGDTVSPLHYDVMNNFLCLLRGTKQVVVAPASSTVNLYEGTGNAAGLSQMDVAHVELQRFPLVRAASLSQLSMHAGDCLFMPRGYWHAVWSGPGTNLGISTWWTAQPPDTRPLNPPFWCK